MALIIDPRISAYTMRPEMVQLANLLTQTGPELLATYEDISTGETRTPNGLAVSPKIAAMCADDFMRTIQFVRGLHAAILDVNRRYAERPARILYAGCGPYATLAVPLMSVFTAAQVQFSLIDIHSQSIESAKIIVDKLTLTDRVADFKVMDAGAYRVNPDHPPDIILMEIMKSCLDDEPQVAVTRHLLSQAPGAILVPEDVRVELALVNFSAEFDLDDSGKVRADPDRDRILVGSVFTLNRKTVGCWKDSGNDRLAGAMVQLPVYSPTQYQPMLFTTISVYKNHVLRNYDSGLSSPRPLQLDAALGPGDSIQFCYELGQHPALKAERSSDVSGPG